MIRFLVITVLSALLTGLVVAGALASQRPNVSKEQQLAAVIPQNVSMGKSVRSASTPSQAQSKQEVKPSPLEGIDLSKMRYGKKGYYQQMEDGRKIVFTVDPEVQRYADGLFDKYQVPAGAAVILNSKTGRVIAMSQKRRVRDAADMSTVALDASPPAASLFKIVTTAALLEKTEVSLRTNTCYAGGSSRLKIQHLSDDLPKNHACVSLTTALGRSINAVYAKLSDRHLNRDILRDYAGRFGFNRPIEFDVPLPNSVANIPSDRLERARTAAGFWHTHISPLHAAMVAQSIAQGGAMLRPYIVDKVESKSQEIIYRAKTKYLGNTVSKNTANALAKALVYTTKFGTARKSFKDTRGRAYVPNMNIAGKTGTLTGNKPYRAYTWFVGLAPESGSEVAIAVLVVNEPKWRIKASQAAALLLKKYFERFPKKK